MIRYFSENVVRLFNSIVLSILAVGLITFGVMIGYYNFDQTIKDLNSKAQNTVELAAISLQAPIWNLDDEGWESIVEAIFLDSDVKAIQVLDAEGEPLVDAKLGITQDLSFEQMASHESLIVTRGTVQREGESIGDVAVVSSTHKARQLIRQTSILIAIFSALFLCVMILVIWVTGRKVLMKPISALEASAIELASGNLETDINTQRNDELGRLAKSFDKMRCSIRKKIVDLNVLNQTGEILAGTRDQIEAMKTSLGVMIKQANVEQGTIYLMEDGDLQLSACYPEIEHADDAKLMDQADAIAERCADEKIIQLIPNSGDPDNIEQGKCDDIGSAQLCVPMMDDDSVFGVMNFRGDAGQITFDSSDEDFALTLARMAVNTIKNIQMLEIIRDQNRTLEHKVQERTVELRQKSNDISNMLQNMQQGIFTITKDLSVHGEYSAFLEEIFERDNLALMEATKLLFDNSDLGEDRLNQISVALDAIIGEDIMMFDFNGHLLTREYAITLTGGKQKILEVDWNPIASDDDEIEKLMVTVRDVTELRGLQIEAEKQKGELDTIGQILAISQKKFQSFITSATDFVTENRALIESTDEKDLDVVTILFRNMHTIKGNARTYGLTNVTDTVHLAESSYDLLRKDENALWEKEILLGELDQVKEKITYYQHIFEDKLERFSGAGDGTFVDNSLLNEIDQVVHDMDDVLQVDQDHELSKIVNIVSHMKDVLGAIKMETLDSILEPIFDGVPSMAVQLGITVPNLVLNDNGIRFSDEIASTLRDVFMHVFRNSIAHGLESAEERVAAGKPEQGTITLDVQHLQSELVFYFRDDGRGLSLPSIRTKAIALGLLDESENISDEDLAELIFHSGLSTSKELTMVSGRGVGMEAVKQFLGHNGGDIEIRFTGARGDDGYRPIEQIISLPLGESLQLKKVA